MRYLVFKYDVSIINYIFLSLKLHVPANQQTYNYNNYALIYF